MYGSQLCYLAAVLSISISLQPQTEGQVGGYAMIGSTSSVSLGSDPQTEQDLQPSSADVSTLRLLAAEKNQESLPQSG